MSSSRFVSGGTLDDPIKRDDDWLQAQQTIDENRRRKEAEGERGSGIQEGGRSLFEVLQRNKAAKQEAFEESLRLKNQFRNLDEDEVEFLDSVLESTRAAEQALKKETTEQLVSFRRLQEESDRALLLGLDGQSGTGDVDEDGDRDGGEEKKGKGEGEGEGEGGDGGGVEKWNDDLGSKKKKENEAQWAVNSRKKKRKRDSDKEVLLQGVKFRKASSFPEPESSLLPSDAAAVTVAVAGVGSGAVPPNESAEEAIRPKSYEEQEGDGRGMLDPRCLKAKVKGNAKALVDDDYDDDEGSKKSSSGAGAGAEAGPDRENDELQPVLGVGLGLGGYSSDEDEDEDK